MQFSIVSFWSIVMMIDKLEAERRVKELEVMGETGNSAQVSLCSAVTSACGA